MINEFYKYPRTYHLPWSPGKSNDDKVLVDTRIFDGKKLIATIKMDGENTTLYRSHLHARSVDSKDHYSRHWVKKFHSEIKHNIPDGWRICGENLFAKHSIYYTDLISYFYGFSVWDENNICLDWELTVDFFNDIGIVPVVAFASGMLERIDKEYHRCFTDKTEGYVVRLFDSFKYEDFDKSVAKFVRANHVNTSKHWMYDKVVQNKLSN